MVGRELEVANGNSRTEALACLVAGRDCCSNPPKIEGFDDDMDDSVPAERFVEPPDRRVEEPPDLKLDPDSRGVLTSRLRALIATRSSIAALDSLGVAALLSTIFGGKK